MGAAAWWHEWGVNDFDRLASALAAGHLIECGCYSVGPGFLVSFMLILLARSKTAVDRRQLCGLHEHGIRLL